MLKHVLDEVAFFSNIFRLRKSEDIAYAEFYSSLCRYVESLRRLSVQLLTHPNDLGELDERVNIGRMLEKRTTLKMEFLKSFKSAYFSSLSASEYESLKQTYAQKWFDLSIKMAGLSYCENEDVFLVNI